MASGHGWVGDFIHRTERAAELPPSLARPVVCLRACLKVNSTHLVLLYSEGGHRPRMDASFFSSSLGNQLFPSDIHLGPLLAMLTLTRAGEVSHA